MKKKKLFTLIGSICLSLVLAALLLPACAPAAPEEVAEEIAALEAEIDDLKGDVAVEKAKAKELQDEIAALKKPAEVYEFRAQTENVEAHFMMKEGMARLTERVSKMSDGRLEIDVFPAGVLCPTNEIFSSVGQGTIDMGTIPTIYLAGVAPVSNILWAPPFTLRTLTEWSYALDYLGLEDILAEAYEPHGVSYLGTILYGDYGAIMSSKPIRSVADFEGKKIRTWGIYGSYLDALGVGVVSMPGEEIYTGISLGTIDGATWSNPQGFYAFNLHEVAKYYPTNLAAIVLNTNAWNELPTDLLEILQQTSRLMGMEIGYGVEAEGYEALQVMREEHGVEAITLPSEDVIAIQAAAASFLDEAGAVDELSTRALNIIKDYMRTLGYL